MNEQGPARFESSPARSTMPGWYPELLSSVVERISIGSRRAHAAVNQEMIQTYWTIGNDIVGRMHEEGWGARVVDRLSQDIRQRFPDAKGYSPRNLRYMRSFAQAWPDLSILQRSVARLPWRHQIVLLEKLNRPDQRLWYADHAIEQGWSSNILALQIDHRLHERAGKAITNFAATLPPEDSDLVQQSLHDPYVFDFLGTGDARRERDVELGLIEHIERFLLEMGQVFAFVGRQVRLSIGDENFYADLLFYHLKLHAYVVVELKDTRFRAEYLAQIGMYMAAVDDLLKQVEDKPTIGLLLCRSKNNVIAEYALRNMSVPIGVAEWTDAITTDLPDQVAAALPRIEEIEAELSRIESRES